MHSKVAEPSISLASSGSYAVIFGIHGKSHELGIGVGCSDGCVVGVVDGASDGAIASSMQ